MRNTRLVRANTASPYYGGLAEIPTRAFGVPGERFRRKTEQHYLGPQRPVQRHAALMLSAANVQSPPRLYVYGR